MKRAKQDREDRLQKDIAIRRKVRIEEEERERVRQEIMRKERKARERRY